MWLPSLNSMAEVLCSSVSLQRTFAYLCSWSVGKHTAVQVPTHSFFETDQQTVRPGDGLASSSKGDSLSEEGR